MPKFELYQRQGSRGRYSTAPTVTIQRRGMIAFSSAAAAKLGNPAALKYLVDKDEQIIGFQPCERSDPNAYAVRHYGKVTQTYLVSGVQLCKYLGLDLAQSRRYPLAEIDGVLAIDLKSDGTVVSKGA